MPNWSCRACWPSRPPIQQAARSGHPRPAVLPPHAGRHGRRARRTGHHSNGHPPAGHASGRRRAGQPGSRYPDPAALSPVARQRGRHRTSGCRRHRLPARHQWPGQPDLPANRHPAACHAVAGPRCGQPGTGQRDIFNGTPHQHCKTWHTAPPGTGGAGVPAGGHPSTSPGQPGTGPQGGNAGAAGGPSAPPPSQGASFAEFMIRLDE